MTKFLTSVSMLCTPEEFETDLRKPLQAMGYEILSHTASVKEVLVCCTCFRPHYSKEARGFCTSISSGLHDISINVKSSPILIPGYQPKKFLAYAAMSDEKFGVPGEWWVKEGLTNYKFTQGNLYKSKNPLNKIQAFTDNFGERNGFVGHNLKHFRKATKEEIDQHFTKEALPEVKKESFDGTAPWEPKNGEGVEYLSGSAITLNIVTHESSNKVDIWKKAIFIDRKGESIVVYDEEKGKHVQTSSIRPLQPKEPEISFERGERVWCKVRETVLWVPAYYSGIKKVYNPQSEKAEYVHCVFHNQEKSGKFINPVSEIRKFNDIPF